MPGTSNGNELGAPARHIKASFVSRNKEQTNPRDVANPAARRFSCLASAAGSLEKCPGAALTCIGITCFHLNSASKSRAPSKDLRPHGKRVNADPTARTALKSPVSTHK
jgi:hypothetical protein